MDKNTELYKAVIRAQRGTNTDIAKVMHLQFKDTLVCKLVGKKTAWFIKTKENDYTFMHEVCVRKMVFEALTRIFNETAEFLFSHAFDEDYSLHKPHYITIANGILKIAKQFAYHASKNMLMKEATEVFMHHHHL